jgi:membrane associated rhomboid family serine protease
VDPSLAATSPASVEDEPVPTRTTWILVAMWIAVYVAMTVVQGGFRAEMGKLGPGVILTPVADEFGSLTAREVASGQVWRTVTATFIHLSLIHLACNLSCLIACGRLLNSWYGGPQFCCVYLVIGAIGNGLAVAGRYVLRGGIDTPCAGGSSVMFGFIALIAVVGWRSKTRFGEYVRRDMVTKLFFFGVLMGIVGRNVLDNYGHAGGAIAGALVGFTHRYLVRWFDSRIARVVAFAVSVLIVVGCVAGQWKAGRASYLQHEADSLQRRAVLLPEMVKRIDLLSIRYFQMESLIERSRGPFRVDPTIPYRQQIKALLAQIDAFSELGSPGGDRTRYARWHELAASAARRQPSDPEMHEFHRLHRGLRNDLHDELERLSKPSEGVGRRPG